MGEYVIEKGIPLPVGYNETGGMHEILSSMQIGDSVLFLHTEWKRARNIAYRHSPKTFTFRRQKNGYRCWRTS